MGFSFNVKLWEKTRPPKAKGSGVGKAITALDKATRKDVGKMDLAEVDTAYKAAFDLLSAFDTAKTRIGSAKDAKSVEAQKEIVKWRKVCSTYIDTLKDKRHALQVDAFNTAYSAAYTERRTELAAALKAAKAARAPGGRSPSHDLLADWFDIARDASSICSKDGILQVEIPGVVAKGAIKASELRLPADISTTKAAAKQLANLCAEFTKSAQTKAQNNRGIPLDANDAIEKEVKAIVVEFTKIEKAVLPLVKEGKSLAAYAKQTTDKVKVAVTKPDADPEMAGLAGELRKIKAKFDSLESDRMRLNGPWQEGGALVVRQTKLRATPGYDVRALRYESILRQHVEALANGDQMAQVPLVETLKQIERAKRLLDGSTKYRAYNAHL